MENKINDNKELYRIDLEYMIGIEIKEVETDTWYVKASDYKKVEKYIENKIIEYFKLASIELRKVSFSKIDKSIMVDLG